MNNYLKCLIVLLTVTGCQDNGSTNEEINTQEFRTDSLTKTLSPDPCSIVLIAHTGLSRSDLEIIRRQKQIESVQNPVPYLERLGWAYVNKARTSFDSGYYHLAMQAALCIDSKLKNSAESLLLRGHAFHSLHQFKKAEEIALQLTDQRGLWFDYGLLGDVLMEQGKLDEAVDVYQLMMDQRPGPQAFSRAAHVRWLKGDMLGAIEMMRKATRSNDPRTPESAAWANVRLATYRFQQGDYKKAADLYSVSLELFPNYAPALLGQGRLFLAQGDVKKAVASLTKAVELNPLPEYQWTLIDSLRLSGNEAQAEVMEALLLQHGENEDPRTFALYLATTGQDLHVALQLAEEEMEIRSDVLTLDTVAWALNAVGRHVEAAQYIKKALSEGTQDARLFYHAGVIAHANGDIKKAQEWFKRTLPFKQMLLPSERDEFDREIVALNHKSQLSSLTWM